MSLATDRSTEKTEKSKFFHVFGKWINQRHVKRAKRIKERKVKEKMESIRQNMCDC
jgi:hypothetical protein